MTATLPPSPLDAVTRSPRARTALAVAALATGGFAVGTTEFVTMGLLPDMAGSVGVSISSAGHLISAYALGVVVGAPLIAVFGARWPRRALLVALMATFVVANAASALAGGYELLAAARFATGLPHGAFLGVSALVAADLVDDERRGRAVGLVMLGLPVGNVVGVPAAAWLGQVAGWRTAYWAVAGIGLVTVVLIATCVPHRPADPAADGRRELEAFRSSQVWLTLLVGATGFAGVFAMYSYIAPTVTDVTGLPAGAVPLFLLVFGLGGVVGTFLGGRFADRSVLRSMVASSVALGVFLAGFTVAAAQPLAALAVVFVVAAVSAVLVVNLQMRLMQVAGEAQTLGAAMNHAALNAANALGAWAGGLVIAAGYGYAATGWVGAGMSLLGLLFLAASLVVHRRTRH